MNDAVTITLPRHEYEALVAHLARTGPVNARDTGGRDNLATVDLIAACDTIAAAGRRPRSVA